jgi:putative transposase
MDAVYGTRDELSYAVVYWIEHTYNHRRRQRGLGKLTPVEFELAFSARIEDAAA